MYILETTAAKVSLTTDLQEVELVLFKAAGNLAICMAGLCSGHGENLEEEDYTNKMIMMMMTGMMQCGRTILLPAQISAWAWMQKFLAFYLNILPIHSHHPLKLNLCALILISE
jgi:hypothetical protein